MKRILLLSLIAITYELSFAQQPIFNVQVDQKVQHFGVAYGIVQDQQGYIWFTSFTKGLTKYDGKTFKSFRHDPENANSPGSNFIISMALDSSGKIWLGSFVSGLDRFDPVTNTFTHFPYKKGDPNGSITDTVFNIVVDHTGNPWISTVKGLETYNTKTGKFTRIPDKISNEQAHLDPSVFALHEDRQGIIWYGTGNPIAGLYHVFGGLLRLDPSTGEQTFYKADSSNPGSLVNGNITAICEDSHGSLWLGTQGNGLHTLDRKTGKFTRYLYDPAQPGKLSRPPIKPSDSSDAVSAIQEDHAGKLWIGSFHNGVNWYDPVTQQTFHFGSSTTKKISSPFEKDTLTGFNEEGVARFLVAADSSTWITGQSGNIYTVSYGRKTIPFVQNKKYVNSFYLEPNGNILWFGTDSGLVRKDLTTNSIKVLLHDPKDASSLNDNTVVAITPDEKGKLYIGAHLGGLDLFDPLTYKFIHIRPTNPAAGNTMDSIHHVFIENDHYLWLAGENGLARVDRSNNNFHVWRFDKENEKGIVGNTVYSIDRDKKNDLWFANSGGLDKFVPDSNSFKHYLKGHNVRAVLVDATGIIWAGTDAGLFRFNKAKDQFAEFNSPLFSAGIETILNILEDDRHNLWVTTANAILKISSSRERIQIFNAGYGVLSSNWNWLNNYKAPDGRLFIGGSTGYYMFKPDELNVNSPAPLLNFSQLIVGGKEVVPGDGGILTAPIWKTEEIDLAYDQNSFSVDFIAVNYNSSEAMRYQYRLQNFDKGWNNLGTDHKASLYNIPPGKYDLWVRAINSEGTTTEKMLFFIISPPWWKTWWAYFLYALVIGSIIWTYIQYRSKALRRENLVLEQKVERRTKQLKESIESLKATQSQLIQSEKMASLGELTAGIAHEIQNPLNFVNNFSEVSNELIDEMNAEIDKGDMQEVKAIASDIKQNLEKINHHGKRADAIVKGMLQHSRSSSSINEPTDINKLADEYLRLAYHGLRAKDKSFNATLKTDYDESIGMINVIPQDIGRVLLNLITNAFYAVNDKAKHLANTEAPSAFEPTVSVRTKHIGNKVQINVSDNGNGIPQNILDKIFQPFFTTKPTGQGTGLGLSLSYDIVKAHGGEIKVETEEGEGSEFVVELPCKI